MNGNDAEIREQLAEAINPDEVHDWKVFEVGGKTFMVMPLPNKWHRMFNKAALPILAGQLAPMEELLKQLVYSFTREEDGGPQAAGTRLAGLSGNFSHSIVESELQADDLKVRSLAVICAAQTEEGKKRGTNKQDLIAKWECEIEESDLSQTKIEDLFDEAVKILKSVEKLGNSLRRRFALLASLLPKGQSFDSLVLRLIQPASNSSVPTGSTS